jgi:hypothetical protein
MRISDNLRSLKREGGFAVDYQLLNDAADLIEHLQSENNELKTKTSIKMGVGNGLGELFVYGDYDSIKAAQAIVLDGEELKRLLNLERSGKIKLIEHKDGLIERLIKERDALISKTGSLCSFEHNGTFLSVKGDCESINAISDIISERDALKDRFEGGVRVWAYQTEHSIDATTAGGFPQSTLILDEGVEL